MGNMEHAGKLSVKGIKTAPAVPFGYRPGNSPLHRCPAPVKLLGVLLLSVFAYSSVPALGIAALGISLAAMTAGIRPWELLRGSRPLLLLALFFFFIRIVEFDPAPPFFRFDGAGIPGGLAQGLSMALSFAGGALLFAVTTMRELRDSLEPAGRKSGRPGGKRRSPLRFGLALSLMLGFLPRFFEIWEEANTACEARGVKRGIRRLFLVIPPVTERMIEKALDTALALEARGLEM